MPDYGSLEKNVLAWYPFKDNSQILVVVDEVWNKLPYVTNQSCRMQVCYFYEMSDIQYNVKFDYIILLDVLGRYGAQENIVGLLKTVSHSETIVLVIVDNKYGLKYFCGEVNQYTDIPFFTMFDYPEEKRYKRGHNYDKASLKKLLRSFGLKYQKFYYPMPDYRVLQEVFTDDRLPDDSMFEKVQFHFEHPELLVMDERELYPDIIRNGVFDFFANSFIVECSTGNILFADVKYASVSGDRSVENSFVTTIHNSSQVTKRPMYSEGCLSIKNLKNNMEQLRERGIKVLQAEYSEEQVRMPYVSAPTVSNYLRQLINEKRAQDIVDIFDRFYENINKSSDEVDKENNALKEKYPEVEEWGSILEKAYIEMIPLNSFWYQEDLLFFDQEFTKDNFPMLFVMYRAFRYVYKLNPTMSSVVRLKMLRERYHFNDKMWDAFVKEEQVLQREIKQRALHAEFYKRVNVDKERIYQHAKQTDAKGYRQREGNVLVQCKNKHIVMFGSGKMCDEFMDRYGQQYRPIMIVDNNEALWGVEKHSNIVQKPESILQLNSEQRMVVICVKYYGIYLQIKEQLKQMGIEEFVWFDPNRDYRGEIDE